jgi:hypothetical protein
MKMIGLSFEATFQSSPPALPRRGKPHHYSLTPPAMTHPPYSPSIPPLIFHSPYSPLLPHQPSAIN